MKTIRMILKEELSKRDQLRAKVKSLYLEELAKGKPSIDTIKDIGFDYPGLERDLKEIAIEWANEGLRRLKTIKPSSQAETAFLKMFDGIYANVRFEKHPNSLFFCKGDPAKPEYWFELRNSFFWCSDNKVCRVFRNEYSMKYTDMQDFIRSVMEEAFK